MFIILLLMGLWGYLMGLFATKKGYEFWSWFFASSPLGTLWLVFSRNTLKEEMSESQKIDIVRKGNKTGIVLSVINVILSLGYFLSLPQ